jgi:hypothetical protein
VFGRLSDRFDTSLWVDPGSTPTLVRKVVGLLVAAWEYARAVAEDVVEAGALTYDVRLEARAWQIVAMILDGSLDIGIPPDTSGQVADSLIFFPTDQSTTWAEDDPLDPLGSGRAFSMGQRF